MWIGKMLKMRNVGSSQARFRKRLKNVIGCGTGCFTTAACVLGPFVEFVTDACHDLPIRQPREGLHKMPAVASAHMAPLVACARAKVRGGCAKRRGQRTITRWHERMSFRDSRM